MEWVKYKNDKPIWLENWMDFIPVAQEMILTWRSNRKEMEAFWETLSLDAKKEHWEEYSHVLHDGGGCYRYLDFLITSLHSTTTNVTGPDFRKQFFTARSWLRHAEYLYDYLKLRYPKEA